MGRIAFCVIFLILLVIAAEVKCRVLSPKPEESIFVSDGVDDGSAGDHSTFLSLDGESLSEEACEHIYGFLPCADNIGGYIFQVVVFECLLLAGDYLLSEASTRLFDIFGVGIFGAIVFPLLIMLPRIALILSSGLSATHEDAQSMVVSSVGLTAGYTVFSLTLQWGVCVIFAKTDISSKDSNLQAEEDGTTSVHLSCKQLLTRFTESGVKVDDKTKCGAGIMLLSLVPFVMVQLSEILESSAWERGVVLATLILSTLALISYFAYQFFDPSDQKRSLEYSRFEHLLAHFLAHIAKCAKDKLVTLDGDPNIPVISRVLNMIDENEGDKNTSTSELEKLLLGLNSGKLQEGKAYALREFLKVFDSNADGEVSIEEFTDGCERLINEAKHLVDSRESSSKAFLSEHKEVVEKWMEGRRTELEQIPQLMSGVFKHAPSLLHQSLLGDGKPDRESIESLFKKLDTNNDGKIELNELGNIAPDFEFGDIKHNIEEAAKNALEVLEKDPSSAIDKQEVLEGITTLLNEAFQLSTADTKNSKSDDEHHSRIWEKAEGLMTNKKEYNRFINKLFSRDSIEASLQVIIGALIVIFLGRPLMTNIQLLSESIGIPSFLVSFVVLPLAINIRIALSARFPAHQKMERTASLTFSEIYGGVLMNNIVGLSIILAIIYARDLTWDYSTEVLIVSLVGIIIGLLAFLRSTYPFWTCILAFSLYPMSLLLVYNLHYVSEWD